MLNLRKLEKIAILSFENALRLHHDAITLYKTGAYPSAFHLSVLSQEEIGKMHIVNDFVWESRTNGRMPEFEEEWIGLLYKHPTKQYAFHRNSPLSDSFSPLMNEIFKGTLEAKKQEAQYVGLERLRGKVNMTGKIKHPLLIKEVQAKEQITKINDYFIVTGVGVRFENYSLDNEKIEKVLKNKSFLNSLHKNWQHMSGPARTRIRKFQKYFNESVVNV